MKHKKTWAVLILVVLSYAGCSWDYYVSDYIFQRACENKDGVFIYTQVTLSDEYFIPIPEMAWQRDIDSRFVLDNGRMLDKNRFDQEYTLHAFELVSISEIGPVYLVQTSVVRKFDQKLLGKAVTVRNKKGWLARLGSFGYGAAECPERDEESISGHDKLIKSIFIME